jgi:hypothetical protein
MTETSKEKKKNAGIEEKSLYCAAKMGRNLG